MEWLARDLPLTILRADGPAGPAHLPAGGGTVHPPAGTHGGGTGFSGPVESGGEGAIGAGLGVNLLNALVLGVLGAPGFGLLL